MADTLSSPDAAVSVVIPLRGESPLVFRAIDSVYSSANQNVEVILVDNGVAEAFMTAIAAKYERLQILKCRTPGVSAARNVGIAAAKAQIVCFLDHDDYFLEGAIERRLELFRTNPDVLFLVDSFQTPKNGKVYLRLNRDGVVAFDRESLKYLFSSGFHVSASTISVRYTGQAGKNPGWNESLPRINDKDFVLRLLRSGKGMTTSRLSVFKDNPAGGISRSRSSYADCYYKFLQHNTDVITRVSPNVLMRSFYLSAKSASIKDYFLWLRVLALLFKSSRLAGR